MTEPAPETDTNTEPAGIEGQPPVKTLTAVERRVLGTLLEKAFTTPANYPLTLSALVTGCNQKSNREPVTHYDDVDVQDAIEALEQKGLAKTIYPESGNTERYRHLVRKAWDLPEPHLAVMTELWLRGRQSLGELRTRASRMVPISSLDTLRDTVQWLMERGAVRADGALSRRGVQVDHAMYEDREGVGTFSGESSSPDESSGSASGLEQRVASLESRLRRVTEENESLREDLLALRDRCEKLLENYEELRTEIRG